MGQKLSLTTRIGRSAGIWRPYFYFTDETGTNLITTDLTNRVRRIRASPGLIGEYKFTPTISGPGVTVTPRGGFGTIPEDTSAWSDCSYTVGLTTWPLLTTGLYDRPAIPVTQTFCICGN